MFWLLHNGGIAAGWLALGLAAAYGLVAVAAVLCWRLRKSHPAVWQPAVTILKPLCGSEPHLYENLRSFCTQEYPRYQVVFGVRDSADPALCVVSRLQGEFPHLDLRCVIDSRQHGSNRKVSNLLNMLPVARFDVLSIVDSDACVGCDYLANVVAPLGDPRVGLVTCIYRSVPAPGVVSSLGAMYVNEWYMPSVMLAWVFGHRGYASGQTLCLRRDTLIAVGGLLPIASHLADDYFLADRIRSLGLRIVLSTYVPRLVQYDPNLGELIAHELRWMRTIRTLRPGSFKFLFITFTLPLALLGCELAPNVPAAHLLLGIAACSRLLLFVLPRVAWKELSLADFWLLPGRDLLMCWVWLRAFSATRVYWRGARLEVDARGIMRSSP